ncbi:NAD(P)-dependent oxidoreductase [Nocardioides pocheonensis]|uniref:Lactate dehydrogenase n=1 Tax=Nocardioides pocheonensis TaxID=661485 RepID=A0A3N0GMU4_9ACTN|nr:NAD(P)-dependent oxidoreductase [Nocardioides pocheonensis]RNM13719.1 lactate dehydrogenase [Nocardioides pocheonensis]
MPLTGRASTAPKGSPAVDASVVGSGPGVTAYGCSEHEERLFRELAPRLGVRSTLTRSPLTAKNLALAAGNRCVSVSHRTPVRGSVLSALSRVGVEYVSTRSIGCNHVDLAVAESVGITVGTVSYSPGSVADYTLMLILMLVRDARSVVSRSAGHDYRLNDVPGRELGDLTVGVIGTGRIGSAVVSRLRGFGCRVLTHDSRPTRHGHPVPLEELLEGSDVVTLHAPLAPDTHHLLDRRRIARMKPGACVVNTGRGALLDTHALVRALEDGHLGGAALDVLEHEDEIFYEDHRGTRIENEVVRRLQAHPNVLLSPHTAYFTDRAVRDMVTNSLLSCLDFESRNPRG